LGRTIDYIETRKDLDHEKLAYYGVDTGAYLGNILPALEKRIKVVVLAGAGFYPGRKLPEVDEINFAPRVKVPVLMINGRYDYFFPPRIFSKPDVHLSRNAGEGQTPCCLRRWAHPPA
jgi:cephalosporin-C deacetylase-like acetyl esterase